MEMPRLTDAHRKLERLAGTWVGQEHLHPSPWDPKGGPAVGRIVNRIGLDGFVVIQDYVQERDGKVNYRAHGVFGWDPARPCYVLTWFDFGGHPSEFTGTFEEGILLLTCKRPQGFSRGTWDFSKDGEYRFRVEVSPDGLRWHPFVEGTYQRQG
jgi:Protein of unknown function (DUF1579)